MLMKRPTIGETLALGYLDPASASQYMLIITFALAPEAPLAVVRIVRLPFVFRLDWLEAGDT